MPPTSSSFLGRPRPICTTRPSLATRAAYGLRRILDLEKSTSGISRSDAADGSRWLRVFVFFKHGRSGHLHGSSKLDVATEGVGELRPAAGLVLRENLEDAVVEGPPSPRW